MKVKNNKRQVMTFCLFASFMLTQLIVLRMGNGAGSGYISTESQELVYMFLQLAVIPGFLLYAVLSRRLLTGRSGFFAAVFASALSAAGGAAMLFASPASCFYLILTGVTVFCTGFFGGAVYLRLARLTDGAARAGLCLGAGYAAAVALQFCFQLQWTFRPVLAALLVLACVAAAFCLSDTADGNEAADGPDEKTVSVKTLILTAIAVFALIIFTSYFNSYIHHLQIATSYTDYSVYTWPRLLMIPAVLLFCALGDLGGGRYLPIAALCVSVLALLNTALPGRGADMLNMCLFYVSLSAVVAYYHVSFLRLAPRTRFPALWACMGRILDSVAVILSFAVRISELTQVAVLLVDVAALVAAIVAMAASGSLNVFTRPDPEKEEAPASEPDGAAETSAETDPFETISERYGLTPGEMRVFRELVTTEDKQTAIGDRLSIKVRTVQANVTSIYRKTGVSTRAGLVQLFRGEAG